MTGVGLVDEVTVRVVGLGYVARWRQTPDKQQEEGALALALPPPAVNWGSPQKTSLTSGV